MKHIAFFALGLSLVLAQPMTADAKPKDKGNKGIPPGQLRKAEVHERLARGESPSRNAYRTPPARVYRDWERDRVYTWEDRRYRWNDGAWVIIID